MDQSILNSTKKILGVGTDDPSFDLDIITHINSAFSNLHDLGVGPENGFVIADDTAVWSDFLSEENPVKLSKVKTVIYLRVRLIFDPPATSYVLNSLQTQLQEAEWRLNVNREATDWEDPDPYGTDGTAQAPPLDTHFTEG
jgi:hypothetical protein